MDVDVDHFAGGRVEVMLRGGHRVVGYIDVWTDEGSTCIWSRPVDPQTGDYPEDSDCVALVRSADVVSMRYLRDGER
jgi:hypothetical protein